MKTSLTLFAFLVSKSSAIKVAFLGDSDDGADAANSYKVIRDNNVDLVLQNGDFDYDSDPAAWDRFLAANWPTSDEQIFLGTSGNHEDDVISTITTGGKKWETENGYKSRFFQRLRNTPSFFSKCRGRDGHELSSDYGNYMVCETDEILLLTVGWDQISDSLIGAGGDQDEVNAFLEDSLSKSTAKWKVCTWHRPEGSLNPGSRHTGEYKTQAAYNICAKYGAFVTSGHSHVYGRSKLIRDFASLEVSPDDDEKEIKLACGQSFSVVTGMGGTGTDGSGRNANQPWMRKVYTSDTGDVKNGVLICDFQETEGFCNFHLGTAETPGHIFDSFKVLPPPSTAQCSSSKPPTSSGPPPDAPAAGAQGCLRDYARGWALGGASKYSWCGNSCCAQGSDGPCYYTVPNPAECGNPSESEAITSSRVREGIDDVEEYPTGTRMFWQPDRFYVDSGDLEMVDDTTQGRKGQLVGLRFQGLEVPPAASITDAYIVFESDASNSDAASGMKIVGHKDANSPKFSSQSKPSERVYTTASVQWNDIEPWGWRIDATTYKRTVDIAPIVQEIVQLQGWKAGNSMTIIIKEGYGKRSANSFEDSQAGAPLLVVKYKVDSQSSSVAVIAGATTSAFAILGIAGVMFLRKRKFGAQLQEESMKSPPQISAVEEGRVEARRPSL